MEKFAVVDFFARQAQFFIWANIIVFMAQVALEFSIGSPDHGCAIFNWPVERQTNIQGPVWRIWAGEVEIEGFTGLAGHRL